MERQWSANSGFISKFLTNIAKMVEFNEVQVTTVPLTRHSCDKIAWSDFEQPKAGP